MSTTAMIPTVAIATNASPELPPASCALRSSEVPSANTEPTSRPAITIHGHPRSSSFFCRTGFGPLVVPGPLACSSGQESGIGLLHLQADQQVVAPEHLDGIDAHRGADRAGVHARVVVVAGAQVALDGDLLLQLLLRGGLLLAMQQLGKEPVVPLGELVHLDVVVWAAFGTGAAADAVVRDDADLAVGLADDPVDRAEQADRVLAVPARRREEHVAQLQAGALDPRIPVPAAARVDAVVAVGADR